MSQHGMDEVFFALADPTRREVISRLSQDGPV
jgi:DNA-binding transcriptional ArsR family regulator